MGVFDLHTCQCSNAERPADQSVQDILVDPHWIEWIREYLLDPLRVNYHTQRVVHVGARESIHSAV
ncbi:MAG TPA: hypothetical protein VFV38_36690 [Ktedonobacteraceae bacterium]|nr:hypothetical protein [Ktedonobacteraceae bacterium]